MLTECRYLSACLKFRRMLGPYIVVAVLLQLCVPTAAIIPTKALVPIVICYSVVLQ